MYPIRCCLRREFDAAVAGQLLKKSCKLHPHDHFLVGSGDARLYVTFLRRLTTTIGCNTDKATIFRLTRDQLATNCDDFVRSVTRAEKNREIHLPGGEIDFTFLFLPLFQNGNDSVSRELVAS